MSAYNGRVEQMHRILMNKARTMRIHAELPAYLWDELYLTVCYLHAWTTTCLLNGSMPFTQWYKKKPDLSHLCKIGCQAFVLIQDKNNPKIYQRSIKCILLGYKPNAKAYDVIINHQKRLSHHIMSLSLKTTKLALHNILKDQHQWHQIQTQENPVMTSLQYLQGGQNAMKTMMNWTCSMMH